MRAVAMAVAVLAAAFAAPVAAGAPTDPPPAIVVSGEGPTTATFTLRRTARILVHEITATATGRYGGVRIERVDRKGTGGTVLLVDDFKPLVAPAYRPSVFGFAYDSLEAGTYRAYLLADGAAEVRLPLESGDPLAVRTTKRFPQTLDVERRPLPAGAASLTFTRPVTRTTGRSVRIAVGQLAPANVSSQARVTTCLTPRGRTCAATSWSATGRASMASVARSGVDIGGVLTGAVEARVEAQADLTAGAEVYLAVVQFERV